ncbi:hypothetical protein CLCR_00140 [Cladophialophora carrionii]|uniref:Uncharacterized protein n=1 Tax=Cladophialophora carrionii TaxID=86049 RepID=A0A1C1C660_9EURO|nr:hypothetical protein CLCR_00140 [Cladophialophora carrionii]
MAKTSNLIPLIILVIVLGVVAVVGFVAYSIANEVGEKTRQKLERKNVSFSKEGMKVGVKHVSQEQQEDAAQSVITKVWNNAAWPNYQSPMLGWGQGSKTPTPAEKRNPLQDGTLITGVQILPQPVLVAVRSYSLTTKLQPEQSVEDDIRANSAVEDNFDPK